MKIKTNLRPKQLTDLDYTDVTVTPNGSTNTNSFSSEHFSLSETTCFWVTGCIRESACAKVISRKHTIKSFFLFVLRFFVFVLIHLSHKLKCPQAMGGGTNKILINASDHYPRLLFLCSPPTPPHPTQ